MRQNSIHHRLTSTASKYGIITACQRSCRKVMFSVMCLSVHGGSQCGHYPWSIGPHCTGILLDMFKPLFNLDQTVQGIPQIPHPSPVPPTYTDPSALSLAPSPGHVQTCLLWSIYSWHMVDKREVGILLEWILVLQYKKASNTRQNQ